MNERLEEMYHYDMPEVREQEYIEYVNLLYSEEYLLLFVIGVVRATPFFISLHNKIRNMKNIYILKETNSWTDNYNIVAVCSSIYKAISMLKEWFEDEVRDKSKLEELETNLDIDEKYPDLSYASINSKQSNAWESLEIQIATLDEWI